VTGLSKGALALAGVLALTGCQRSSLADDGLQGARGRFAGVGIYQPGPGWDRLTAPESSTDPSAAKRVDDQAIIVVVDSRTGEVRACGDLSGYCVGMNPWRNALVKAQMTPVSVTAHAKPDDAQPAADTNAAANVASSPR
jgi:hypothetical protein